VKQKIKSISEVLKEHPSVVFAYLFGSRAKQYANARSDWDVAVYLKDPESKLNQWPAFELEAELSRTIHQIVQVTILNESLPPLLGFEIVKDGILLVDRNPNLRTGFENKVMRTFYDWQYFLKRQMESEGFTS